MVVVVLLLGSGKVIWVWEDESYWGAPIPCLEYAREEVVPLAMLKAQKMHEPILWGSSICLGLETEVLNDILRVPQVPNRND